MTEFILPLLAVFSLSARAAKPAAPNNSANLDAKGMTPQEIKEKYFTPADNMHTSPAGAELNAQSVVEGLKQLKDCPLAGFLKAQ